MVKNDVRGLQWITGADWTIEFYILYPHFLPYIGSMLSVTIHRGEIPGLKNFLLKTHPDNDPDNIHEYTLVSPVFK